MLFVWNVPIVAQNTEHALRFDHVWQSTLTHIHTHTWSSGTRYSILYMYVCMHCLNVSRVVGWGGRLKQQATLEVKEGNIDP